MASTYDPVPDAIAFLSRKSPLERHAIARLLEVDGAALRLLAWIAAQPDCDLATAAMIYWRLRGLRASLGVPLDLDARNAAIDAIADRIRSQPSATSSIGWDGREAWDRQNLIAANPSEGVAPADPEVAAALSGPFTGTVPEPAEFAFLDEEYEDDDIFDSLWRVYPNFADAADWLAGKSPETWMVAVDDLSGSHADEILGWMVQQPECATSVAGQIFWRCEPAYVVANHGDELLAEPQSIVVAIIERWKRGDLIASDLDFSRFADAAGYRAALADLGAGVDPLQTPADLIDPAPGRISEPAQLDPDFAYWYWRTNVGGLVERPRAAALAQWQATIAARQANRTRRSVGATVDAAPPSWIERKAYGEKFTGDPRQTDRAWRQFVALSIGGAILFVGVGRWVSLSLGFWLFMAWVAIVSVYQSSVKMGGARRMVLWWALAVAATAAIAILFRWQDSGGIG